MTSTIGRGHHNQGATLSPHEIEQRIRQLHADGLKPRDISSLVGIHPQIVLRVLARHP